ncbi:MAG: ATP-binding cassette domain-containing protein [Planctomycetes bacterium]|nr:ATP-binding cassette domain-containing protein [Planctomycetota bacterium]
MSVESAPAGPALLGCRDLVCGHGRPVLRGVTLQVARGDAWYVLGPNGAGKSTLVATLLGLLRPLAGEVSAPCGGDRRQLGFVPQEPRSELALPVTVREWVGCALDAAIGRVEAAARIAAALAAMGVEALAARDLRRLSLGQRRRVHVARALVRAPQLLVLDEPGANLDRAAAIGLAADLDRWRREQGLTVVMVAHDLELARRFASHAAIVFDGVVHAGPAGPLLADPALVAAVAGEPVAAVPVGWRR